DGYKILGGTTSLPINESLHPKRGYTADDFKAISIVATSPEMISAPPGGAKPLEEFIDNARASTAQFGTAGAGSASYIVTQYFFERVVKIPTTHVPFQGGATAVTAAMGNEIPLVATPPAAGAAAPVKAGALRGLAIASEKRMTILPDVPTYGENGYPGFVASAWTGFFVPAKTPDEIAKKLNAAINEILKDPDVAARLEQLGFEPLSLDQNAADSMFRSDIVKWRSMVEAINLKPDCANSMSAFDPSGHGPSGHPPLHMSAFEPKRTSRKTQSTSLWGGKQTSHRHLLSLLLQSCVHGFKACTRRR